MSERRACRVLGVDRTSVRYQATRPDDGALRDRLKALAQERRRFGYRRLHVLLRREGHTVNRKRVQRIYREERLTVRRRGGRKLAMGSRRPLDLPLAANPRWSLDFVAEQMTDGRRFRILTVIEPQVGVAITAPANAWRWWLTPHCRVRGSCGYWTPSSGSEGGPTPSSANRRSAQPQRDGIHFERGPGLVRRHRRRLALHRARRAPRRTALTRASTDACATRC